MIMRVVGGKKKRQYLTIERQFLPTQLFAIELSMSYHVSSELEVSSLTVILLFYTESLNSPPAKNDCAAVVKTKDLFHSCIDTG